MYTVRKPINLRGRRRVIGEIVGKKDVDQGRAAFFIRNGYLSEINGDQSDATGDPPNTPASPPNNGKGIKVDVPIIRKDGSMALSTSPESVSMALWLLQTAATDAIPEIGRVEDEDILIILDACDTRKTVKEAARNRAVELRSGSPDGTGGG